MRDDDVRLSEGERAAFDDLARRLSDDRVERDEHRHRWPRRCDRRTRRTAASWLLIAVGGAALLTGLFLVNLWLDGAGLLILLFALQRLTRRWNWARTVLWWRRRDVPPSPPDHMWEP